MKGRPPLSSTIPEAIARAVETWSDADAVIGPDTNLSYAQLARLVDDGAVGLATLGVRQADTVAIWAPNSSAWIVAALAVYRIGAILVPVNTRYSSDEAADIVVRAGVSVVLTAGDFLGVDYSQRVAELVTESSGLTVVTLDDAGVTGTPWSDVLAAGRRERAAGWNEWPAVEPNDVSDLVFTSGTTGAPKGAMLTHGASVLGYSTFGDLVGMVPGDRLLAIPPFFHCFGLKACILASLLHGVAVRPVAVFNAAEVASAIEEEQITILPGPPTVFISLLDDASADLALLTTLRLAITGAAKTPPDVYRRIAKDLRVKIAQGYGLTEATALVSHNDVDDDLDVIATTVGRAVAGMDLRIVDADNQPVRTGEPGELVVRGPLVMRGYWNDPEATAMAIDASGWLHTGDIGTLSEDGYLRITDRIKDMYIVGGFNVYPAEVELIMAGHPDIEDVAVVGVPDRRMGEVGTAFVVLRPGRTATESVIIEWSREHMANFKAPRRVIFIDALPRNASGKVLKFALAADAAG
jgi:acyl-CoA synthetase (AMP-forming)/AMP-acid ligase II